MKRILIAASAIALFAGPALARDQLHIAGSSTVLPYAQIVAEEFGKAYSQFKTPVVESGGSGAGIKQFCQGVGDDTIDIANSSRPIKKEELATCAANGVKDVMEVKFGYDGIVFAVDKSVGDIALTPKDLYLALAAQVPVDGKMADNPNKSWKDVNASLPDMPIVAFVPGEKHGTREVFEQKVLAAGCKDTKGLDAYVAGGLSKDDAGKACVKMRKDGAAVDIDGDYTETLARIDANKQAVGVFGLSFYENNADKLKVATVDGIVPSVETVANGTYPVSRPLFFYVKKAHIGVVPGLQEYTEFFVSDKMSGSDGALADEGLVPEPAAELKSIQDAVKAGTVLSN
ncbi:PstS family phosphate ABC transporter substrate-binding protein [Aestuariivirga sp.]|uniref:PstS family phosphate ABC transporter substrate-binding protein n=1 Tax=Aestuariivirga sp. TaxID=2650926 RepID=UPI0039E64039